MSVSVAVQTVWRVSAWMVGNLAQSAWTPKDISPKVWIVGILGQSRGIMKSEHVIRRKHSDSCVMYLV